MTTGERASFRGIPEVVGELKKMSTERLLAFKVEEAKRQVAQINMMISEFERMYSDLEAQIKIEEDKSGISDPQHFAYPTFAKAAKTRQDNLQGSIDELKEKKTNAEASLYAAEEELVSFRRSNQSA